jgi:AbrB family looped-hinge helix DNA binding protein
MEEIRDPAKVNVGPQGRIIIPAGMRKALGIGTGDVLVARVEDGRMILETRDVLARVHRRFDVVPEGVSLADELIRERQEEARRERGENRASPYPPAYSMLPLCWRCCRAKPGPKW